EYTCQVGDATDSDTGLPCSDGYYGTTYEYEGGTWWAVGTYCMARAQCETSEGTPLDEDTTLPCVPTITSEGIVLVCQPSAEIETWNVRAEVNTSCPINEVMRAPYPRALVNVTTTFILSPALYNPVDGTGFASDPQSPANLGSFVDAQGNPTEHGYEVGIWKDFRLLMRSHRFNGGEDWFGQTVPQPQWHFDDRSWNANASQDQQGPRATYIYQTSSAGLSTLSGRAFDMVNKRPADSYNLPAYGVTLRSYCGHDWKVTVKVAQRVWQPSGACYATELYPDGTTLEPEGTSNEGCEPGYVSPGQWSYGWQEYATEWTGIDLRQTGRATAYDSRTRTRSGGFFKDVSYWDTPSGDPDEASGIWVPVLEVQSVLRSACVASGECPPPKVEPTAVTP
ncbi:MAG: hypothetical protein M1546_02015, partial [Chloroflexi bacterium]|nr:hypothetical protein [Chloroflexota bacterium]